MLRRGGARDPLLSEAGAPADGHGDGSGNASPHGSAGAGSKVEESAQGGAGGADGEDPASQFECHICLETAAGA